LLIYRIRASHIGLVQLQDKIVVRFALTIYPYSLSVWREIDSFIILQVIDIIDTEIL